MAFSFNYDGTDMRAEFGLKLQSWSTLPAADPRIQQLELGGRSGSVAFSHGHKSASMVLESLVIGDDDADRVSKWNAALLFMDPDVKGERLIIIDEETDRNNRVNMGYFGLRHGPSHRRYLGDEGLQFQLFFLIPEGVGVTPEVILQDVVINADPMAFNVPGGTLVVGTKRAWPVYDITNTDSAAVTSLVFTNSSLNQAITWADGVGIAQNDILRIDSERDFVEISTDGGATFVSSMLGVTIASVFPELLPDSDNVFSLTGFVAGTIDISYRGRFRV